MMMNVTRELNESRHAHQAPVVPMLGCSTTRIRQ